MAVGYLSSEISPMIYSWPMYFLYINLIFQFFVSKCLKLMHIFHKNNIILVLNHYLSLPICSSQSKVGPVTKHANGGVANRLFMSL